MRAARLQSRFGVIALTIALTGVGTVGGCGGGRRDPGPAPGSGGGAAGEPPAPASRCGDAGAACPADPFGIWTCPVDWGVCTRCEGACPAELVFRHDHTLWAAPIDPLGATAVTCTNATYQLGYDGRGRLTDSVVVYADGRRQEVHVERDPAGWATLLRRGGTETRTTRWERDAAGRVTREQQDGGNDGVIDHEVQFERDAAGRVVRHRIIGEGGRHGNDIRFSLDHAGRVVREVADHDGDGQPDAEFRTRYDDAGRVVEVWRDDQGDGKPDRIERTSHDAAGRVTRTWTNDQRGRTIEDNRNAYDAAGHLVREWSDLDGRGRVERSVWHEVDAAGHPVRTREDTDGDGTIDVVIERRFDGAGRELLERTDEGADGSFDERGTGYDAAGRRVETWTDLGGDGVREYERTKVYDAAGLRVEARISRRGRASVTRTSYDADRREIGTTLDEGADGTIDATTATTYDAAGRQVWHRDRRGAESRWRYDDQGRLVERIDATEGGSGTCQFRYDEAQWARWRAEAPAAIVPDGDAQPAAAAAGDAPAGDAAPAGADDE